MTEINIQRKSGSSVLWWILALVALLIVGWLLFAYMGTDTRTSGGDLRGPVLATALIDSGHV